MKMSKTVNFILILSLTQPNFTTTFIQTIYQKDFSYFPLPVPIVRAGILLPDWCPSLEVEHSVAVPPRIRNLLRERCLEGLHVCG